MNTSFQCLLLAAALLCIATAVESLKCNPGERFKIECNWCTCARDGVSAACTRKGCTRHKREQRTCTPGETFTVGCNKCRCGSDGTVLGCSLVKCPDVTPKVQDADGEPPRRSPKASSETCVPGESFMKDCNYCTCTPDGNMAACTLMACSKGKRLKRSENCVPGQSFKKDCNDCICSPDGRTAACTLRGCVGNYAAKVKRAAQTSV